MPKKAKELSQLAVNRLSTVPGLHAIGGVAGLCLQVKPPAVCSWILRATVGGKRRWIGLGSYPEVPTTTARDIARKHHEVIARGIDPIEQARAEREAAAERERAAAAKRESSKTFKECAAAYIAMMEPSWRNKKHHSQWLNTLAKYAEPIIGDMFVADIERVHVMQVLEPIWLTKTETAKRVRHRIHAVLDWAEAKGYRQGENPALWRGRLQRLLPAPSRIQTVEEFPSLPHQHIAEFMRELRAEKGKAARALEVLILTAARTGETVQALWQEIDWDQAYWKAPAPHMKGKRVHRKLLSRNAIAVLRQLHTRGDPLELIFPSPRKGGPLSDMALSTVLKRIQKKRAKHGLALWTDPTSGRLITTHGFRATFKTWVGDATHYPREMAEMQLSHVVGSKTEMAYWRGDMLDKRRHMMEDWAAYCSAKISPDTAGEPLENAA